MTQIHQKPRCSKSSIPKHLSIFSKGGMGCAKGHQSLKSKRLHLRHSPLAFHNSQVDHICTSSPGLFSTVRLQSQNPSRVQSRNLALSAWVQPCSATSYPVTPLPLGFLTCKKRNPSVHLHSAPLALHLSCNFSAPFPWVGTRINVRSQVKIC